MLPNIDGFPNYHVTRNGKIIRICDNKELKLDLRAGYVQIQLTHNKIRKGLRIARLVAQAYIENPYNLPEVNHINSNKTDNTVENLEWCSRSYNIKHSYITNNKKPTINSRGFKLTAEKVSEIKQLLKQNIPQQKIAEIYSVGRTAITMINTGKTWN